MKPISKGDLVMAVRGHVCDIGKVFTVAEIDTFECGWHCDSCGYETFTPSTMALWSGNVGVDVLYLIRIDPPALSADRKEELTA